MKGSTNSKNITIMTSSVVWIERHQQVLLFLVVTVLCGECDMAGASRILGIFPTPSFSHQLPFQVFMKALVARGHHVTVISTDPLKEQVENYTDIDISLSYVFKKKHFKFATSSEKTSIGSVKLLTLAQPLMTEEQLNSSQIKEFLRSNRNRTFDLAILEWNGYNSYMGLVHSMGSPPVVGILSLGGINCAYNGIFNPHNPAINSESLHSFSDRMTFWQRIINTFSNLWLTFHWEWYVKPSQNALLRKYFGEAPPSVWESQYNMSLLIENNHWTTEYPHAMLPSVLQIAGIHVHVNPGPLPLDLQEWMDGAEHGVVYMSLGSNVMSKDLPLPKREAILRAFARLPQRVLWKWEEDDLPGRPPNVRVGKWLPQQSVLQHPRLRLFVTQGGLQSFQEAVFHAVPLLGIPFMADQYFNVEKFVTAKVGRWMSLSQVTEERFLEEMDDVLRNKSYQTRMDELSMVFREHKASSLDTALWWIEYVLRHKGAPHLRSAAQHLAWYQYLLLDVLAAALAALLGLFFGLRFILRSLCQTLRGRKMEKQNAVNGVRKNQ